LRLELDPKTLMYQPNGPGDHAAASVCPALKVDFEALQTQLFAGADIGEHGVVHSVLLAQSTNHDRNLRASSGGIIKELMLEFLARDEVDGVIALKHVQGLRFEPGLITSAEEVDSLPGSIYHNLPLDNALRTLREHEGRFVLAAIPCQLEGIYNYLFEREPALKDRIYTTVGLLCGWNYSHHALKALCGFKGLEYAGIEQISYRGGGPVGKLRLSSGATTVEVNRRIDFSYQVAFDRSFNIPRCHLCINHTNFLAQIVVGDAWLPGTVGTRTGISIVICRTRQADAVMRRLEEKGKITLTEVTVEEITESQSHNITFGDFSYAYADFLRGTGRHAPEMEGPNRVSARLVRPRDVERFDREYRLKRRLQQQGRYRRLWWRKATLESRALLMRYVRWFFVRVLKVKSLFGTRTEVPREQLSGFR
jgi:coenzyme F420-reducing hydrogenase beta subunit